MPLCPLSFRALRSAACTLMLAVLAASGTAHAQTASAKAPSVEQGRKLAQSVCSSCHGPSGISDNTLIPTLAAQNSGYLNEQMRKYAEGIRKDQFMVGMIRAMSPQERASVVMYYNAQPGGHTPAKDAALVDKGRRVFASTCVACHGQRGQGNDTLKAPRVMGQQEAYLVQALKRYRNKTGERVDPQMTQATAALKDDDIKALAAYLSQLR